MQLERILNLYTKEEQEFLKKVKKVKKCCRTYHGKQRRYDADRREDER